MIEAHHVESVRRQLAAVESALNRPGAAAGPRCRELVAEHTRLRDLCDRIERWERLKAERAALAAMLEDPDEQLCELARADAARLDAAIADAERAVEEAMLPADPDDARNVVMEIRAGTGGEEAALFAADLFRMYSRYADRRGWRIGVVDVSPSDLGGYKEIVSTIEGDGAHGLLRYESGVHRVQRVPVTEQSGRIHTSAATVAVLAEAEEMDHIEIRPDELRMDLFRASGAGGQKVNKTESAVRLIHLPSGLVVQCQDERSQARNKEKALRVLKARLLDLRRRRQAAERSDTRRSQIGTGDRSERIRTYNFPQNRVTDHRINLTLHRLAEVLDGDLDELIGALRAGDRAERLRRHLEEMAER